MYERWMVVRPLIRPEWVCCQQGGPKRVRRAGRGIGPGPICRGNVAYANDDGCDADDEREDEDEHGSAADHKRRRVNISS